MKLFCILCVLQRFFSNQIGELKRRRGKIVVLYSRIKVGMVRRHALLHKQEMVFHVLLLFQLLLLHVVNMLTYCQLPFRVI